MSAKILPSNILLRGQDFIDFNIACFYILLLSEISHKQGGNKRISETRVKSDQIWKPYNAYYWSSVRHDL